MEEQHERLFDLIESKSFEELTKEERAFVLEHLTEVEYTLQRNVIGAAAELEYSDEEPLALALPKAKNPFKPIRATLPGIDRCGLSHRSFPGWKPKELLPELALSRKSIGNFLTNGAASGKIIHDTIVREIPVFQTASTIIRDTITIVQQVLKQPEKRMLEVSNSMVYPELSERLLENKGSSYQEDQTTQFLPAITVVSTMK